MGATNLLGWSCCPQHHAPLPFFVANDITCLTWPTKKVSTELQGNPIDRPGLVALQFCAFEISKDQDDPASLTDVMRLLPRHAMKRLAQGKIIKSQTQGMEAKP